MKESEILEQLKKENPKLRSKEIVKLYKDLKAIIVSGLKRDQRVVISGVGIFLVKDRRKSRAFVFEGRSKGVIKDVAPTKMVVFRVSGQLRKLIKEYYGQYN